MSPAEDNEFASLLKNHPALTMPTFTLEAPKHGVKHFIPTNGPLHCTGTLPSPKAFAGETTGSKRQIQNTGQVGHCPEVKWPILITTSLSSEARG